MASRSRPKNFPPRDPPSKPELLKELPVPVKPHPGYPGHGPPLPGRDYQGSAVRTPPGAEKYYPEWSGRNTKSNQLAESERLSAERLLKETKELIAETRTKVKHDEREVDARFKQRVGDIAFWKGELDLKLGELEERLEDERAQCVRVESALAGCAEPLAVAEKCLAARAQRQGVDLVEDNVAKHLQFEVETLKNSQVLLKQTHMQVLEELRQLQKRKHAVEQDLKDKDAALEIDQQTAILKVTGPEKKVKGVTKYPAPPVKKNQGMVLPADWQEFSEKNLQAATLQLQKSIELEATVDGILAHVSSHLKSQKDLTDRAFDRRLAEVREAKRLLEEQLAETVVKVSEMEEAVVSLERAIAAKQGPLATCQLRIQQRKQRPGQELVLDDVDLQLQAEAANIVESVNRLEEQLAKSRNCYASLQRSRLELEAQIGVKTNSVYIDEVKCKTIREGVNIQTY